MSVTTSNETKGLLLLNWKLSTHSCWLYFCFQSYWNFLQITTRLISIASFSSMNKDFPVRLLKVVTYILTVFCIALLLQLVLYVHKSVDKTIYSPIFLIGTFQWIKLDVDFEMFDSLSKCQVKLCDRNVLKHKTNKHNEVKTYIRIPFNFNPLLQKKKDLRICESIPFFL